MKQTFEYIKTVAEKPDTFVQSQKSILPSEQIEILKKIPRLAMGEIRGVESMGAVYAALDRKTVDAFLPTVVYTGTEYGEWKTFLKHLNTLKKKIEKTYQIYCLEPVFIGAPEFWGALNGRFMHELLKRFKFYSPCLGCRIYCYAVRIPLCKQLNCSVIISGGTPEDSTPVAINASQEVMYYCNTLLSNFGINLMYRIVEENKKDIIEQDAQVKQIGRRDTCSCCLFKENFKMMRNDPKELHDNTKYFEQFAIPAAAKIVSRVLAGKMPDYLQEVMNTLLPVENIKTKKAHNK